MGTNAMRMKRQNYTTGWFRALTIILVLGCSQPRAQAQLSDKLGPKLDKVLAETAEASDVRGAGASVVFKDGSVWSGTYGNHGTEPLTTDMLFEMGSNTKTFVAATILQMVNEGKVALSDSLSDYLDSLPHVPTHVTIEQLLNHTSGIYSYTNHDDFVGYINADPTRKIQPEELFDELMNPIDFEAGTSWSYSNTNYILLGLIIEEIDEKPLHESFRKRLYEPNGLEHTYLDEYETYTDPRTGSWLSNGQYLDIKYTSFMTSAWAAGAIISTTEDLAKWAKALYTGKVVGDLTETMVTKTEVGSKTHDYGLGAFIRTYRNKTLVGHGGTTLQNSEMEYSEDGDFSVVAVVNEQGQYQGAKEIQNALLRTVWDELQTIGINETQKITSVRTYPNPANNFVRIQGVGHIQGKGQVKLFDMMGKEVLSRQMDLTESLDVQGLPSGTYSMIVDGDAFKLRSRVLIQ